jgi:hypothetical protein
MKTLLIVDGDITFSEATGLQTLVDGPNKGAQDVAETLLSEYSSDWSEGNELLSLASNLAGAGLNETLAYQYLYEAVTRLITSQRISNLDEKIIKIVDIRTKTVGLSYMVFLVKVLFDNGQVLSVVDKVVIKPVSLNHIGNLNGIVGV